MSKLVNICANSLKRKNLMVMADKVLKRLKEKDEAQKHDEVLSWCAQHQEPLDDFLRALNADLFNEAQTACVQIKTEAEAKLSALGLDLGGGGNYPLLYFLVRHLKARNVLETGVAAGWSSQAILTALKTNANNGQLFSSDFPYFRYKNPEQYVGYVVNTDLKANWHLEINGDQNNIPLLLSRLNAEKIDLFHYDSDKSYEGRTKAYEKVQPHLSENAVIIFDDIQDNAHFMDWVNMTQQPFKVFEFEGKFIGLTGSILDQPTKKA